MVTRRSGGGRQRSTKDGPLADSEVVRASSAAIPEAPASALTTPPKDPVDVLYSDAPARIAVGDSVESTKDALPTNAGDHRQTPYRADTVIDGWTNETFSLRAASVRGDSHRLAGVPREDDFGIGLHEETNSVVIAVADGVSSAPQSHIGAMTACRYAVDAVLRQLDGTGTVDLMEVARNAAWSLVDLAQRDGGLAEPDPKVALKHFATTLVVAWVRPADDGGMNVRSVLVGDSGIAKLTRSGVTRLAGGKPLDDNPDAVASNVVIPLPIIPEETAEEGWALGPDDVFLVATDGIWDPLGDASGPLGRMLAGELLDSQPSLIQFARVVDFSKQYFVDDRTLVALWRVKTAT